jgi:hypothetical protein
MSSTLKYCLFFLTIFIFNSSKNDSGEYDVEKWQINSSSSLKVDGKTNINNFECIIPNYGNTDTLTYLRAKTSNLFQVKGSLMIKIKNFDCHHRSITKDMQKTLNSDIYPYMYVKFQTFSDLLSSAGNQKVIYGDAEISLSGEKKIFRIGYSVTMLNKEYIELKGNRIIHFSDFNLKPPSKLGGTIKVRNELEVEFKLLMRRI